MALFQQQSIAVTSVGENVGIEIGSYRRSMHYEVAFLLSWWMQKHARAARKWAGFGPQLRACGTLHDAEKPDAGQPFDPRRVHPLNRDLLKLAHIAVRQDGDAVAVKFGADEMKLPHKAAVTIAQWVRMRAKESKRRAGDVSRDWREIGQTHDYNVGPEVTRG
jgi:hypothetical protein